jgi:DNA-directed RNA polymerase subunit beta
VDRAGGDKKDVLAMRIDQSTKLAATTFLRCLDESVASTDAIISLFYEVERGHPRRKLKPEHYAAASIIDTESGEELVHVGRQIGEDRPRRSRTQPEDGQGDPEPVDPLILNTIAEEKLEQFDADSDHEAALLKIYAQAAPGNPPQVDKAKQLFHEKFFDDNRYRLGKVGRFRINRKFDLDVPEDQMFIRARTSSGHPVHPRPAVQPRPTRRRAAASRRSTTSTTWATGACARSTSWRSRRCARASSSSAAPSRSA